MRCAMTLRIDESGAPPAGALFAALDVGVGMDADVGAGAA
jgi:hypothetical protein